MPYPSQLIDKYNRTIHKLRLSLTDRCNLRCRYCMPLHPQFVSQDYYLQPTEYQEIVTELAWMGIKTVRLTGGEPLIRKEFPDIIVRLARIPNLELSLTTNGVLLEDFLPLLKSYQVQKINISLDSLKDKVFERISYSSPLKKITASVEKAVSEGFQVKLNTVVMRDFNDREMVDIVEYAKNLGVEVRFLELMQIGYACHLPQDTFISAKEMLARLQETYQLMPISSPIDSTAFRYQSSCGAVIGFIGSESQPFCNHCSRWRLSADGILRACLFREEGISLKGLNQEQRQEAYQQVLGMKPIIRSSTVAHPMYKIGG